MKVVRCPLVVGVVTGEAAGQRWPKAESGALSHCGLERANRVRPHSTLGYRPPAPEALLPADPVPVPVGLT